MKTRLTRWWDALRSSLWFVPMLMTLAAVALAFATVQADERIGYEWIRTVGWLWTGGPEGAREVLSTIAGSMITVAGVTFSITVVTLTLASNQFGPRLLRNFMRDTGNQIVLGTFIATFIYCLLVLRTVRAVEATQFVPYLSVTAGVLLATISLGVLIYFIHHVSESIQAENLIAVVAAELQAGIDRLFPDELGQAPQTPAAPAPASADSTMDDADRCMIRSRHSGYVQAVESETLLAIASNRDLILHLLCRPGDFVTRDDPLAAAWPAGRCDARLARRICGAFLIGRHRTPTQDVEYAVHQLVEIAVRALSPGINDPFTAMNCLDWLGAALAQLAQRDMPGRQRHDARGQLRIIAENGTFAAVANAAFNQIRQYGRGSASVVLHMLDVIAAVAPRLCREEDRKALLRHAAQVEGDARASLPNEMDRQVVAARYQRTVAALNGRQANTAKVCGSSAE
ncbi:DUF2254 domain-containing protein [Thermithiobacillus tepidarius DSM 3134]|uniref:DUF2254 domain-containing protein n=1 Tax=Thermithiobacillus tepidarius TaxID=929 RepID=UPI000686FA8E|nr:DUF2254 domain-containing protein [Thermithiobacillus tepidarius]